MQYAQLGTTDLNVSRICFGTWQLSPRFWGEIPLAEWREALHTALEHGINFIDTADAYGDGFSESTLGDELRASGTRDRFVVATKFYWNITSQSQHPDTRRDYILRACETSLKRLKTDRIDLYQIHAWDPLMQPEGVGEAFAQLHREGKVRWFGVSNWNPTQISLGRRHFQISSLQPKYSLLSREIEKQELPCCMEHRIGTLVYSPLARGLLGGKYKSGQTFNDQRASEMLFQGPAFEAILEGVNELRLLAEASGLSVAQFAIRWVLTHPGVTSAIVGIKSRPHLDIASAADGVLSQEIWHRAAEIMENAKAKALKNQANG